jgi:hypothetical protein
MIALKTLAVSALVALALTAAAQAGSSQCVAGADPLAAQCSASPRDTQLATDYTLVPMGFAKRSLGCTATPCTESGKEYACTYHYTATFKQCSMCCSTSGAPMMK